MTVEAYGWEDLKMNVSGAATGGGSPTQTVFGPSGNIKQIAFGVNDSVYLQAHVDHRIRVGSTSYLHVHWSSDGTNIQPVVWQLSYILAEGYNTQAFPADTILTLTEAGSGVAWQHMIIEDAVGIPAPATDSLLLMELKRISNGGTDNSDTVYGLFVDLHFEVGQVATPNRSPNFFA